jgi:hypothetical protein
VAFPSSTTYPSAGLYPSVTSPTVDAFPASRILDRFLLADSTTELDFARNVWTNADPYGAGISRFGVNGQRAYSAAGDASDYSRGSVRAPCEAWWTATVHSGTHELTLLEVVGAARNGYAVTVLSGVGGIRLKRLAGGAETVLATYVLPETFASGDGYGVRIANGWIEAWWQNASAGTVWQQVGSIEDTTYGGPFRLGIYTDNGTARFTRAGFGPSVPGRIWPGVLIDWNPYSANALEIGTGLIGTGVLNHVLAPDFVEQVAESYSTDVTPDVLSLSVQRGRQDAQSPVYSGAAEVVLRDSPLVSPKYRPGSGATAIYGWERRPLRILATYLGQDYNLFTGYVRRARWVPSARGADNRCYVSAEDGTWVLSETVVGEDNIDSGGVTTTNRTRYGTASFTDEGGNAPAGGHLYAHEYVDLWTEQAGFPWVNVGTASDTRPWGWEGVLASDDSRPSPMSLISDLLIADRGAFYIDAGGTAVYQRRTYRYGTAATPTAPALGTITAMVEGLEPQASADNIYNAYRLDLPLFGNQVGGTVSDAVEQWGGERLLQLSSAFWAYTQHATSMVGFLQVTTGTWPQPPEARRVKIPASRPGYQQLAVSAELNRPVRVDESITGLAAWFWVDGIEHQWDDGAALQTTLSLTPHFADPGLVFTST